MKWNGRSYRPPGYGIKVYPTKQDSITELLKPLGEKTRKGNVWVPVLNQPLNVLKESGTPTPVVSASPTPTQTGTPTPTPTPSSTVPEPSPSPTGTPTPTPSQQVIDYSFRESRIDTGNKTTYDFTSVDFGGAGLIVVSVGSATSGAGTSITNVTIDGVTATQAVGGGFSNLYLNGLFYAVVTGSTGTVSITTSATSNSLVMGVWRIVGYSSTTPYWTGSASGLASSLSLTTSSLPSRSMGIGVNTDSSYSNNFTWTNATERFERNNGDVGYQQETGGADFLQTTTGTRTVTVSNLTTVGARFDMAVWS
jgi:hypothetical protein